MLVFEKVEGIIANCSNSYHFVIREIPLDGPEFHMLALELNGAAHFHGWIPSTHIRGPPTRGEMAAKTECAKAQLQWRDQSDCAEPRREILRQ